MGKISKWSTICSAGALLLALGSACTDIEPPALEHLYHQLSFNMSIEQVEEVLGKPDLKIPKLMGETWIWRDEGRSKEIQIYFTPDKTIAVGRTEITPEIEIHTGRLITKELIETQ